MFSPPSSWSILSLLVRHPFSRKEVELWLEAEGHEQLGSCSQHEMHCCSLCQYVSHLLCGSVAVVPSLEARQSQAPFRGCAHHSPGRRVPHRDEQHGKEDVKEDVVSPDLSQA